jgi:hypothetical protein
MPVLLRMTSSNLRSIEPDEIAILRGHLRELGTTVLVPAVQQLLIRHKNRPQRQNSRRAWIRKNRKFNAVLQPVLKDTVASDGPAGDWLVRSGAGRGFYVASDAAPVPRWARVRAGYRTSEKPLLGRAWRDSSTTARGCDTAASRLDGDRGSPVTLEAVVRTEDRGSTLKPFVHALALEAVAVLIPPPRRHRRRSHGALAPTVLPRARCKSSRSSALADADHGLHHRCGFP